MKNLITLALVSLFSMGAFAQTSLEYSQVKLVSSTQETVPAGKVWKLTGYYLDNVSYSSSTSSGCSAGRIRPLTVNGGIYYFIHSGNTNFISRNDLPMWLPAGTTVNTACPADIASVIEFNIVP